MDDTLNRFVDIARLITQTSYSEFVGISKQRVNQKIKANQIESVSINGGTLVLMTEEEVLKLAEQKKQQQQ